MTTLVQIEEAVAELAPQDQRSLLQWLQGKLEKDTSAPTSAPEVHERWLNRLEQLRNSVGSGIPTTPTDEIINDLRSDRD